MPPGRFLEKDDETDHYVEVDDEKRVLMKAVYVIWDVRKKLRTDSELAETAKGDLAQSLKATAAKRLQPTNEPKAPQELKASQIKQISDTDVVCGSNPLFRALRGNQNFRDLCQKAGTENPSR